MLLTGLSDVIGSWKIIAIFGPRISRSRARRAPRISSPSSSTEPGRIRRPLVVEAHHGEAGDALAGAGLADDAERLSLLEPRS